jgi:uncharacterized protein YbbC (DUF1343 family)
VRTSTSARLTPIVRPGLDALAGRLASSFRGQRIGLLCHPASVTSRLEHAIPVVRGLRGARLRALFAPEHGVAATAQDLVHVGEERHRATGLRVWSLYGKRLAPEPSMLAGLDAVIVDLQDVGSRYYTYLWTLALTMRACAAARVRVVVLDRPNPLGGVRMEGNLADPRFASFVGLYPLVTRHGMTIGELAAYLNAGHAIGCELTVVPMQGWRRRMRWEDTGLPFVPPSPNMPTPETARVYPGGCLLEGTNLSEGRGTTRPFEWTGAPYLDGDRLARALARRRLPGVAFTTAAFVPTFQKWAGRRCEGVQVHVTDADRFRPVETYLCLIAEARRQAPRHFRWRRPPYEYERRRLPFDILMGGDATRRDLERGVPVSRIAAAWRGDVAAFARARRPFLRYR